MYARLRCGGNLPLCVRGLGTRNRLLRYRICVPCSKRPPPVRDAFSVALGVKNRLLRYGRDIRCQKQPSVVRDASSKARRTADSTDCGQPPVVRDAFSEAYRVKSSLLPHRTHLQCAKRPRSEVSRHKKRVLIKVCQDFLISLYQSLFRSFFDIRQELSTHACTLAKRPGKAGRGHLSALPCTAALFAHVPSAHHKSHAERWMLLSQCFSKHLHHIMDKSFLNLQTGRAIIYNPSYF